MLVQRPGGGAWGKSWIRSWNGTQRLSLYPKISLALELVLTDSQCAPGNV